jgi:hypothetical protein
MAANAVTGIWYFYASDGGSSYADSLRSRISTLSASMTFAGCRFHVLRRFPTDELGGVGFYFDSTGN